MAWPRSIRRLGRFLRLSGADRALVLQAMGTLWAYRIGLWLRPFQLPGEVGGGAGVGEGMEGRASATASGDGPPPHRIAWAVRAASHAVPAGTCLVQALAARRLLARAGHSSHLHLGAGRDEKGAFEAHAWLEVEGEVLVGGGKELDRYVPFRRGKGLS